MSRQFVASSSASTLCFFYSVVASRRRCDGHGKLKLSPCLGTVMRVREVSAISQDPRAWVWKCPAIRSVSPQAMAWSRPLARCHVYAHETGQRATRKIPSQSVASATRFRISPRTMTVRSRSSGQRQSRRERRGSNADSRVSRYYFIQAAALVVLDVHQARRPTPCTESLQGDCRYVYTPDY
jgi:hypothetical protein